VELEYEIRILGEQRVKCVGFMARVQLKMKVVIRNAGKNIYSSNEV
jgi:hypothetical protein